VGGYLILRGLYRGSYWAKTSGFIVGYNTYGDEIQTTYAVVTYHDAAPREHKCELKVDWFHYPPLGSPVALRYSPRSPTRVEFERAYLWWTEWLFFVGLFGIGLTLSGALIILVFRSR